MKIKTLAIVVTLALAGSVVAETSVLMVVTSAETMDNGKTTGLWLEEYAVPALLFQEAGFSITIASPEGGQAPIDPRSLEEGKVPEKWKAVAETLKNTKPLDVVIAAEFDAVFIPGGHGTMFDFPGNDQLKTLIEAFAAQEKPIAAVCHGPAALVHVSRPDGKPLVAGKKVTAFTDAEEEGVELTEAMPFLLESRLRELGADFSGGPMWKPHIQVDGKLITGQNPASSKAAAEAVVKQLQ